MPKKVNKYWLKTKTSKKCQFLPVADDTTYNMMALIFSVITLVPRSACILVLACVFRVAETFQTSSILLKFHTEPITNAKKSMKSSSSSK